MQPAAQIVGRLRLLGPGGAAAARGASSAAAALGARVTLPNGSTLDLPESSVKFTMPPEWAPHAGTWMAWPVRRDVWRAGTLPARKAFTDVMLAVAEFEPLTVIAHPTAVSVLGAQRREGGVVAGAAELAAAAWACGAGPAPRLARSQAQHAHPQCMSPCPPLPPPCSGPRRARRCPTTYA